MSDSKNDSKNSGRKVIPFTGKYKKQSTRLTPAEQRSAAATTIAFVLFLMIGFNFSMFEARNTNIAELNSGVRRGIASVPTVYEPQWKEKLSQLDKNMIQEVSQKPTAIDQLNFGPLAGKYAMRLENGRITQIELSKASLLNPQVVANRAQFISQYAGAFVNGFMSADKINTEKVGTGFKETYRVYSAQGESTFEFQLDEQQKFVSLLVK